MTCTAFLGVICLDQKESVLLIHLGTQVKNKRRLDWFGVVPSLGNPPAAPPRAEAHVQVKGKVLPEQRGLPLDGSSKGRVYPAREMSQTSQVPPDDACCLWGDRLG